MTLLSQDNETSSPSSYNRRTNLRIDFRSLVRFVADPKKHLILSHGITQNLCQKGLQILSSRMLEVRRPFELWIATEEEGMIPAIGETAWMTIEDSLGDSPYWLRCGIHLHFKENLHKELLFQSITKKFGLDLFQLDQSKSKIGYIF